MNNIPKIVTTGCGVDLTCIAISKDMNTIDFEYVSQKGGWFSKDVKLEGECSMDIWMSFKPNKPVEIDINMSSVINKFPFTKYSLFLQQLLAEFPDTNIERVHENFKFNSDEDFIINRYLHKWLIESDYCLLPKPNNSHNLFIRLKTTIKNLIYKLYTERGYDKSYIFSLITGDTIGLIKRLPTHVFNNGYYCKIKEVNFFKKEICYIYADFPLKRIENKTLILGEAFEHIGYCTLSEWTIVTGVLTNNIATINLLL